MDDIGDAQDTRSSVQNHVCNGVIPRCVGIRKAVLYKVFSLMILSLFPSAK